MNYLKITLGIFIVLAASRFIPHPPNFTSLIALSFYVPLFLGKKIYTRSINLFYNNRYIYRFSCHSSFYMGGVLFSLV